MGDGIDRVFVNRDVVEGADVGIRAGASVPLGIHIDLTIRADNAF